MVGKKTNGGVSSQAIGVGGGDWGKQSEKG